MQDLIRINSENPPGDESKIGFFVANYFKRLGLKPKIYEFKKGRPNILVTVPGQDNRYSLLITPHLDTVPAGRNWHFDPFGGKIYKNRIYGRGATDCKVNLACSMEAINSLLEDRAKLTYNLIFAATADEESGSGLGLIPLLQKNILHPDAAVVLDADDFFVVITQKGLIHLKIKIEGKKAHGAYPWLGINAIDIAVKVIQDIKNIKFKFRKNPYLRPPTVNIGTIKGGDKVNIVADWCEFEADFRFLPGTSDKPILNQLKRIVKRYAKKFKIEIQSIQKPYLIDKRHYLVRNLVDAMKNSKIKPLIKGSQGATVITFFQEKGIPAVATGFGTETCAHMADEYVEIDNLHKGAQIMEYFLRNYKGDK